MSYSISITKVKLLHEVILLTRQSYEYSNVDMRGLRCLTPTF